MYQQFVPTRDKLSGTSCFGHGGQGNKIHVQKQAGSEPEASKASAPSAAVSSSEAQPIAEQATSSSSGKAPAVKPEIPGVIEPMLICQLCQLTSSLKLQTLKIQLRKQNRIKKTRLKSSQCKLDQHHLFSRRIPFP